MLGDVLAGSLVKPKVGQWAWYTLTDNQTKMNYALRQAIVGEEKVGRKTGYWVEIELVPELGYPAVYKMLLTGPASDPKNLHRLMVRQGTDAASEVPVETMAGQVEDAPEQKRTNLGDAEVQTVAGTLTSEHVILSSDDHAVELWLNDDVRPMGIVRMRAAHGELMLREYGEGGENGQSRIDQRVAPEERRKPSIETEVLDSPDASRALEEERQGPPAEEAPTPDEPTPEAEGPRKNFNTP